MNYYFDTEFIEGTQKKMFGKTKPTIELISIGIVDQHENEYYAISKDFNLKEAWNRYDLEVNRMYPMGGEYIKKYWIRNNVLKPIFIELWEKEKDAKLTDADFKSGIFNYKELKRLINKYGKTRYQIQFEILGFVFDFDGKGFDDWLGSTDEFYKSLKNIDVEKPKFYAYYCSYDWVVFCWIFGKMIDLPKSFPMYCRDLQQIKDEVFERRLLKSKENFKDFELPPIKTWNNYPTQENEHNALDDAKWNMKLHKFLEAQYDLYTSI